MASFFKDIERISLNFKTLEALISVRMRRKLCDPSVPLREWEEAAFELWNLVYKTAELYEIYDRQNPLCGTAESHDVNGSFSLNFDDAFNFLIKSFKKKLDSTIKIFSSWSSQAWSDRWYAYGTSLSDLTRASCDYNTLTVLMDGLACLAVIEVHHKARRLRSISKFVEGKEKQMISGHVEDLIHAVDQLDQAYVSIRDVGSCEIKGLEVLVHDSIYDTARRCAVLPSRMNMMEVQDIPVIRVNGGGFADIYEGRLSDGRVVALKTPRCFGGPEEMKNILAEICREALVWHFSKHKNILPLLGIGFIDSTLEKPGLLTLVTPFMPNGSLRRLLRSKPDVDRPRIIAEISHGLCYLHEWRNPPVVHGDLKCDNILMDANGRPRIADFGLSRVKDVQASLTGASSMGAHGSLRWQAPELLCPETFGGSGKHTFASDIYAFGMTCLEIITGQPPYAGFSEPQVITAVVLRRKAPDFPDHVAFEKGMTERKWGLIKDCWNVNAHSRPTASYLCFSCP